MTPIADLSWLPSRDLLVAIGVTMCLLGLVLRSIHQGTRRAEATRAQMTRLSRLAGKPDSAPVPAAPSAFVRRLPLIYRSLFLAGAILALTAFWR